MKSNLPAKKTDRNFNENNHFVRNELFIVLIIALIATTISFLPLLFGYHTASEKEVFMGIPVHVTDANNHLHLAKQVKEGNFFLTNKFSAENFPRILFNPYHILIGLTAKTFNLSVINTYNFFWAFFSICFFFVAHLFIKSFLKEKKEKNIRILSLIFIAFSGGFGFWWILIKKFTGFWYGSSDLWVSEINTFTSLGQPHFMFALILFIFVLYFAKKAFESKKLIFAFYSGIFGFILSLTHLFEVVTFTAILCSWFLVRLIVRKKWSKKDFYSLLIIGILTLPGVVYYTWVFFFNEEYAAWNSLNQTITPNIIRLVSGLGIVFIFSLIYIIFQIISKCDFKNSDKIKSLVKFFSDSKVKDYSLLITWIIINLVLVYLPINVQRRFIMGIHIPTSIIAGIFVIRFLIPFISNKSKNSLSNSKKLKISAKRQKINYDFKKDYKFSSYQIFILLLIIVFAFSTNAFITVDQINKLHYNGSDSVSYYSNIKYLTSEEYEAMIWLENNVDDSKVVIAPYYISNYIPAITGNKVFSGHWAQTINFEEKYSAIELLYSKNIKQDIVKGDILWWEFGNNSELPKDFHLDNELFRNNKVIIYEVSSNK